MNAEEVKDFIKAVKSLRSLQRAQARWAWGQFGYSLHDDQGRWEKLAKQEQDIDALIRAIEKKMKPSR